MVLLKGEIRVLTRWILFSCMLIICSANAETAQQVFNHYQKSLLQIQVIEKNTQQKYSYGSGFFVSPELVITNYHVLSDLIEYPDRYDLVAKVGEARLQSLEIMYLDVINDLALLKAPDKTNIYFNLAESLPEQGAPVFSLGNPHDLGMVVVPGTYNGFKQHSFYPRLHLTGSINSGMSGGPSVNGDGLVIGVNVATGGNQLGFIVPVDQVKELLGKLPEHEVDLEVLHAQIHSQLILNQNSMMKPLLEGDWDMQSLGSGVIPENIASYISCWGSANPSSSEYELRTSTAFCRLSEDVFLSDRFVTGKIQMQFEWVDGSNLPFIKFNHHYQKKIAGARANNKASHQDVTEFKCQSDIVDINEHPTRTVYCIRGYKNFPDLYDTVYLAATVPKDKYGFIRRFSLAGVSKENTQAFTRKFMESVVWQ